MTSMALLLALILALAAVFAPVAMTEEGPGCVENDVQIDGQELRLRSQGCESGEESAIVAAGVCIESEVRIDGQAIALRAGDCSQEETGLAQEEQAQPQTLAEAPSAPLHSNKPVSSGPSCRNHSPRPFPPV
jgi:hypothetical protein